MRRKYGPKLYEAMQSAFCLLPLATVVEQRIFITHGGLFREHGVTLDQLRQYVFRRLLSHVEGPIMISTNRLTVTTSFPFSGAAPGSITYSSRPGTRRTCLNNALKICSGATLAPFKVNSLSPRVRLQQRPHALIPPPTPLSLSLSPPFLHGRNGGKHARSRRALWRGRHKGLLAEERPHDADSLS